MRAAMRASVVLLALLAASPSVGSAGAALAAVPSAPQEDELIDPRDGKRYPVVRIAGHDWMGRNLDHRLPGSYCFDDEPAECDERGALYPWEVAMRACPPGWHLSTEEEWRALEKYLGLTDEELAAERGRGRDEGEALKPGGSSGLAIPLAGWRRPNGEYRAGNREFRSAALWVADRAEAPETAWHRDLSEERSVIWRSPVDLPYALSVRCVRDPEPRDES